MKKLSLFSLFGLAGLLAFITTPIYAQEDDISSENEDIVTAVEGSHYYPDYDDYNDYDYSDYDGLDYNPAVYGSNDVRANNNVSIDRGNIALLGGLSLGMIISSFLAFLYSCLIILAQGEVYRKAGKKLWAFLIPFWGTMVYSEIAGIKKWTGILPWLLVIIPLFAMFALIGRLGHGIMRLLGIITFVLSVATLIWLIITNYRVARRYGWGKFASVLHAIIILCPITILVLGLGNYKYQGITKKEPETIVEA